jgi:CPA2 family monovalent cation:H+ antiporter-2
MGLSDYEAKELEKTFYKLDRAAVRDLAQVWIPGVPMENNAAYVARAKQLNRELEDALITRFTQTRDESTSADKAAE